MFSPSDGRNWGAETIAGAMERLCWASSRGDIVLIGPASNTQFNGLSDLNVQNLGRGPAGETVRNEVGNGGNGCTLN